MRVIAGKCRSLQLKTPKGLNTRPTQDRIKETLFNIIQEYIPDAIFLDVFAGSGGIGIEALSRGAKRAWFLDKSRDSILCIKDNLNHTHMESVANVVSGDVFTTLHSVREDHADVIFMDPPYDAEYEEQLFETLKNCSYVDENTLIILESDIKKDFSIDGFELIRCKEYKTNKHSFYKRIY